MIIWYLGFTKHITIFTFCTNHSFHYSTNFYGMNARELSHTCMHLFCLAGEGSFVFNERSYHIEKNNLVVIPDPNKYHY